METFWGLSVTVWTAIYTLLTAGLLAVAVVAALYARAQWRASREQIEDARRAQLEASRPYVIVTAEPTPATRKLFDLSVRNIGKRPALDVSVDFDPPPKAALDTADYKVAELKMLTQPIAMIAPDQDMRALWDSHIERHGKGDLPLTHRVKVTYHDSSGTVYTEESVIDLNAMEGATYVESKSIHDIGKTLEQMAKTLKEAPILSRSGRAEVLAVTETLDAYEERLGRRSYEDLLGTLESAKAWDRSDPTQVAELQSMVNRIEQAHPDWVVEHRELSTGEHQETLTQQSNQASGLVRRILAAITKSARAPMGTIRV